MSQQEAMEPVIVDFRSDTITKPGTAMRKAMAEADVGDDVYGEDPTVNELQRRCAELFGKEAALFVPTGTMGNLISILVHCRERSLEAILGHRSHILLNEQAGISQFAGVMPRIIQNKADGTFDLDELRRTIRPLNDIHQPFTKLICLENSHNFCGGKALPMDFIREVWQIAKEHNLKVHTDGARILNAAIALGVPVSEIMKYSDSVSMCFSKVTQTGLELYHTKIVKARKRRSSLLWLHKPKRKKTVAKTEEHKHTATPKNIATNVKPASDKLLRAPEKAVRKRQAKGRKRLFEETVTENLIREMQELVPSILKVLQSAGSLHDFCKLLRLLSVGQFPTKNIAFLLLLDVVRWYSMQSTTKMTYRNDTMKFWRVMYRLFHGKVLRFMSGMKSAGQVLNKQSERGQYDPGETKINFAVPDQNTISQFNTTDVNIPREVSPGVITQSLGMKDSQKCYVLSVDGKKLAPGLTTDKGDIDLFGYEDGDSLQSTKDRLHLEMEESETTMRNWSSLCDDDKRNSLERLVHIVSVRIKDMRTIYVKQSLALNKFEKEAGNDWRNSKYVFAISSIQAMIYQLKSMIRRLLDINNSLLQIGASINNESNAFISSGNIDAFTHLNWVSLKEPQELPEDKKDIPEYTKQRTSEWFDMRSRFAVTGSRIYEALGLDTLKNMQKHIQKVLNPDVVETIPDIVMERMEHGSKSEINAVATLVGKILPFYFPGCRYIEEGSHVVMRQAKPLMLISPDGSIGHADMACSGPPRRLLACEFKCPVAATYKTSVHYDIPQRYISQVLAEMAAMNVSELIYLCWTAESSTVFRVTFDPELWEMIETETETQYLKECLKKPTRISDAAREMKEKMKTFSKQHVRFICEVPSLTGSSSQMSQTNDQCPYLFPITMTTEEKSNLDTIGNVLTATSVALKDVFQLCRKKASEVLVWLLSDTDRNWNPEVPHALPVAYAMKGYSLSSDTMRKMHQHILNVCQDNSLDIVCSCFDGQWVRLATRDANEKPLTQLQLQRDVWETARKTQRSAIVHALTTSNIVKQLATDVSIFKHTDGTLYVRCDELSNMMASASYFPKSKLPDRRVELPAEPAVDTLSCLPDEALETLIHTDEIAVDMLGNEQPQVTDNEPDNRDDLQMITVQDELLQTDKSTPVRKNVSDVVLGNILYSLKTHQKVSISSKWKEKSVSDLKTIINDSAAVHKLTHDELNTFIKETEMVQKESNIYVRKSWNLNEKANGVCKLIGSGEEIIIEKKIKKMLSLKEFASKVVMANSKIISKSRLNNVYAASIYRDSYTEWKNEKTFATKTDIQDLGSTEWFSYPEFNKDRNRLEPKCLDAHHLLVNIRVKVCKDGVLGIRKEAWHSVAESDNSIINKGIVVDLVDRQNNAFALKTFSEDVENKMRELKFDREAEFCKLIRNWYEAEDEPGISALERVQRRLRVKEYLLRNVNFGRFPPYGMHVKGFSKIWFEGMLQRIDTTIQLYSVVNSGCFNQRSISSLANETFFGELSDMEPTKLGCPKAINIPRLMSTVTELMHYRCDPSDRVFQMVTTKRSVYPKHPLLPSESTKWQEQITVPSSSEEAHMIESTKLSVSARWWESDIIVIKDHSFDIHCRRKKKRVSKRSDISKPHEVSRGCLPVRQHHKCDESKILPTTRLGIEMRTKIAALTD